MSEFENYLTGTFDLGVIHDARNRAVEAGLCLDPPTGCGMIAAAFRDALSAAEYRITGLCQSCQDGMYGYLAYTEAHDGAGEYLPDEEIPPF